MKNKVNEIRISYCEKIGVINSPSMNNSEHVAKLLFENWDKQTIGLHETFKVLLLNNANKVKGTYQASTGGLTGTLVDLRILFAVVLKTLSVGIIIAHNHPSGKKKASEADINLTAKIKKAAELLDIRVLDHLIILPTGDYFSFADNGML
ncbi:JAB domain-containing protein [Maribacter polysiphoniae]|uniref:JAB domain-containing protein n=1 Tax=Maribacter polysiphoniae TaxID=429344 RepID=A0A316DJT4_9FLAO|nr:JAB domain-containing protein [Maribacter polysiphoniae]MBD1263121.1 JAB domain-containing protein [Maribacter polysiphoniae]PWK18381.1 RadC-like JAB domain-containing protein [Maribacter polysiphoniae]